MKEFIIATDVSNLSPLELQLFNLKLRLRLQLDMVERTRNDIEVIEELLKNEKKNQENINDTNKH